jgi:hypothetical protein
MPHWAQDQKAAYYYAFGLPPMEAIAYLGGEIKVGRRFRG